EMGRAEDVAKKIWIELEMRGLHKEPLGIDIIEPPVLFALQREGIKVVDGQALVSEARAIKTQDEVSLLDRWAWMVDDACGERARAYLDAPIELVLPGRTTAEIAAVWPKAEEFGFPNEEACFALQYGHGVGLAIWEKPVISRLVSFDHPCEIKPGMVFALET